MKGYQRMKYGGDFARLRREGRSQAGKYVVLATLNDPSGTYGSPFIAGLITSKKVGIAVVRNRVRRRLRAIIDEFEDRLVPGTMMVVIARYRAPKVSYQVLRDEWELLAKRAGILSKLSSPASLT
ncbi:MAG: ribonuclease P protein component [Verrucomicrobiales bacterium]|jgi:ribonuclease P protein component